MLTRGMGGGCRARTVGGIVRTPDGRIDYAEDFFGKPAFLTVSGQLNGEYYACALSNIYTFGPTFRCGMPSLAGSCMQPALQPSRSAVRHDMQLPTCGAGMWGPNPQHSPLRMQQLATCCVTQGGELAHRAAPGRVLDD